MCSACTRRDGQRQEQKVQNRELQQEGVVRKCSYKSSGVLCATCRGRDDRCFKEAQNRRLRQVAVVRSGRYNNGGVLCTERTKRESQPLQEEVQNQTLRQAAVVRSGRYKKRRSTVHSTHRTGESASTGTSAQPKAAARGHRSEGQVQKR